MDRTVAKETRAVLKKFVDPVWREAVNANLTNRMEARVLGVTARAAVSDQNVMLKSAAVGRQLTGGLRPFELMHNVEFGADRSFTRSYEATSKKGRQYRVTKRHTRAQFRARNRKGYVVYPAAAEVIPRVASAYVQVVARAFHESFEQGA